MVANVVIVGSGDKTQGRQGQLLTQRWVMVMRNAATRIQER
jgi:hypothetical protein